MTSDVSIPLTLLVSTVIAIVGAFAFLVRQLAARFEKSIDEKLKIMSEQRVSADGQVSGRISSLDGSIKKLTEDLHRLQIELPREYTRKEDHVQALATVNAKIDAVQAGQQQLIMMVGTLRGRSDD